MTVFDTRELFSNKQIEKFTKKLSRSKTLQAQAGLSVYVTGSYGRKEAGEHSDLDLFLIRDTGYEAFPLTESDITLIKADLHNAATEMGLPPFSRDMVFLKPHELDQILTVLGSPSDDFYNHFTARMLLLLESRCLFNEHVYENSKSEIIFAYYRDYHDHRHNFVPLFLVNDVHRYWRTLCLNYEHSRNKVSKNSEEKNRYHIMNLKLKFSRMLTCFSAIIPLSRKGLVANHDFVRELTKSTALQRLRDFAKEVPAAADSLRQVEEEYGWFLEATAKPKSEVRDWIGNKENRILAFGHAKKFRSAMFEMLKLSVQDVDGFSLLVL